MIKHLRNSSSKDPNAVSTSRRDFIQQTATLTGGLIVGFYLPLSHKALGSDQTPSQKPGEKASALPIPHGGSPAPNAFIQIGLDHTITITINKLEMGQGVNTSLAQVICDELDCDWAQVRSISAPVDPVYNHTAFNTQMTGGSTALFSSWEQHRKIGASMREMLKMAAAQKWNCPVTEVRTEKSFVLHPKHGKLAYADLAVTANRFSFPENPPLKDMKDFSIIGKSVPRVDAISKSNGQALFGLDIKIPNMLYAVIARPPAANATLTSVNDKRTRAVKGVIDVVRFGHKVAVLAKNSYAAMAGRDALEASWDTSKVDAVSHESLMTRFRKQANEKGLTAAEHGNVEEAMKSAKSHLNAEYEFPFLAHASMEPMNCTIQFDGKEAEIWAGHQMPTLDRDAAAKVLGVQPEKVKVNTTYAGGSFGRRANKNSDYVIEAAELVKVAKRPLKVVWTREDDMRGGYYRPMNYHRVSIGLSSGSNAVGGDAPAHGKGKNSSAKIVSWNHHIVGQSVIENSFFEQMMVKKGLESTITEGVSDTPYELTNFICLQSRESTPITTLWWRSVGHSHTAYVMETMIDEAAVAMKRDPIDLRQELLSKSPRHLAVLDLLKKMTGWGHRQPPHGRAWGVAIHESFNSVVGHIAEVSMVKSQSSETPRVHRVWSAAHCGKVINPEGAKSQIEGAIVYGLSAALYGEVKIANGQVVTGNFNDYPVMRLSEMPQIEVAFVETSDRPTGLGEPGLPPIAPAVANAVFVLTKKRLRKLPMSRELQT